MRWLSAALAAILALGAGAGVAHAQEVEHREFDEDPLEITGEITAQNPNDYFRVFGLDAGAVYGVELSELTLAVVLFSDDFGEVLDHRAYVFPNRFEELVPNQEGELFLAVCATDAEFKWTPQECETGVTFGSYSLYVEYVPEPGAAALGLAALLCLAALGRRRSGRRR